MQPSDHNSVFRRALGASDQSGDDNPGETGSAGQDMSAERSSLRIVVVEDEPFVRLDVEATLKAAGHEVVGTADTADGAVKMAARERPDLVIMDIRLVGARDGVDAAIEIWERYGIRSLFASANLDNSMRARASHANPLGFVNKPFINSQLLSALPEKPD